MLTLNEFLKEAVNSGKAYEAAILSDMLRQSKVLQIIPIKNVNALQLTATRWRASARAAAKPRPCAWGRARASVAACA